MLKAGVIAVQGDVAEHVEAIERAADRHGESCRVETIRSAGTVPDCDLLLLPGGESTTISRLLAEEGIDAEIRAFADAGNPVLATCAGLIVASSDAKDDRVTTLDLLDVSVDRNAFGRQKDSFETDLGVSGLGSPFPAVFIRAPTIDRTGAGVETLAAVEGRPVAVRQDNVLGTSFHPELTDDSRIHGLAFFE